MRIQALFAAQLEREGIETDLAPLGRRRIPASDLHVGSTAVLLGRAD